jgi:hypothetical protein
MDTTSLRQQELRGWVLPATLEHVDEMEAYGFRDADELECQIVTATGAAEQCRQALSHPEHESYTIMSDEGPVGMFGVVPCVELGVQPGVAVVWYLCTDRMYRLKHQFLAQNIVWLNHMQRYYPTVFNYVHDENKKGKEWCKFLGFDFVECVPYGSNGELFWLIKRDYIHV